MGDKGTASAKQPKKRRTITFEEKMSIINKAENGESMASIGRGLELSRSTINTIVKDKRKILQHIHSGTDVQQIAATRVRCSVMEEMERLLKHWIEVQNQHGIPPSLAMIQENARRLHRDLKTTMGESSSASDGEPFNASWGWFRRFKIRAKLDTVNMTGEAAGADADAANEFPKVLAKIIEDGEYCARQVFNVDETDLFWKKRPARTDVSIQEQSKPGLTAAKDRLTLLLGGNAAGDFKLKPLVVHHSENPRAFKGISKCELPVIWKSNRKGRITSLIFENWFIQHFVPSVEMYCSKNNLDFKGLLVLDNASGHPASLTNLHPKIKVIFLPPNTASLLQPMDQTVIGTFKQYYLRTNTAQAIKDINSGSASTLEDYWRDFNIFHAVQIIRACWSTMKESTMNRAWGKLCPQFLIGTCTVSFQETTENITDKILKMENKLDHEVDASRTSNRNGLFEYRSKEPSSKDLIKLKEQTTADKDNVDAEEATSLVKKTLNSKNLAEIFKKLEDMIDDIEEFDPEVERSSSVVESLRNDMACYKMLYNEVFSGQVLQKASLKSPLHLQSN